MKSLRLIAFMSLGAALAASPAAHAQKYRVGLVAAFSGAYAQWGQSYKREIDLYMQEHNGRDGNPKIDLILRDAPGTDVARTKQIVQEFIVRENVAIAGGGEFSPEAFAVANLVTEAKVPYVIFNGATSIITDKSPYFVRIGNTNWQPTVPIAEYAAKHGCKHATLVITDYAPGADSIEAFKYGFKKAGGGDHVDVIKVPIGTIDFSATMQKAKDYKPECLYPFLPGGPMVLGYVHAYVDSGLSKTVPNYGTAETSPNYLPVIGDAAIGIVTAWYYDPYLDNPMNKKFIAGLKAADPQVLDKYITTYGYDGMEIIFHMLKATNGERDGDKAIAAIKGYKWESPTGPIMIDPATRDAVRNIYIRRVVKENGMLINKTFETDPGVKDQWHELHGSKS
jgi:branched-chain amino acid transport system substrate-binding protein